MASIEDVFSLRLVIIDFCMEKPILGLDPCYSEFRGQEIKRVPIIRIFGPDTRGYKTCMHVHGVFPYFYVPYVPKDFESLNKAIYQIATNVDKAINISLGQGSASAQHVFKIQLVKGIPFYGYHRGEHQFLKIYMYNPRFIRRAANLLQNGAILGRVFQPHESHVPYVLQFMIDYNLYGMSLLHLPLEVVKFRRKNDEEVINYPGIQTSQILSASAARKQSSSALEVDIVANFILNRFQLMTKSFNTLHTNPGIESIWHDEKMRRLRAKLNLKDNEDDIPPLEVPATQERPYVKVSESDIFYRTALLSKLETMNAVIGNESDQTANFSESTIISDIISNTSAHSNKKQKFNLKKILANAVYPEECSQNMSLTNASYIENHLTKDSVMGLTLSEEIADSNESVFLDNTILDEELILSLTQHVPLNATLREEDFKLLEVLEQLEEETVDKMHIDLDSSLAQLSQNHKNFDFSPHLLNKENAEFVSNSYIFSDHDSGSDHDDDANLNDFTMVTDDINEVLLKLTESQEIIKGELTTESKESVPQIDGSDDQLQTPTKSNKVGSSLDFAAKTKMSPITPRTPKVRRSSIMTSAVSSPRTPKSSTSSKYAPLPLTITKKTGKKNCIPLESKKSTHSPKDLSVEEECQNISNPSMPIRRSRRIMNLDKTHITCALTPRRTNKRKLKIYHPESNPIIKALESIQESTTTFSNSANEIIIEQNDIVITKESEMKKVSVVNETPARKNTLNIDTKTDEVELIESDNDLEPLSDRKTPNLKRLRKRLHKNKLTKTLVDPQYYNESTDLKVLNNNCNTLKRQRKAITCQIENNSFNCRDSILNSPSVFSDFSSHSPVMSGRLFMTTSCSSNQSNILSSSSSVVVTPLDLPPKYNEVIGNCVKFGISEYDFLKPFYNNPFDIRHKTEIGNTVLAILGNKLNDCEEFCSLLGNDSLKNWRKKQLLNIGGPTMLNRFRNTQRIREYFTTDKNIIITPLLSAPNNFDIKIWLNNKNNFKNIADENKGHEEESPLKITRQKVTMSLNEETSLNENDKKNDTLNNLTLTLETSERTQEKVHTCKNNNNKKLKLPTQFETTESGYKSKGKRQEKESSKVELAPTIKCVSSEPLLEERNIINNVREYPEKTQLLISSCTSASQGTFASSGSHNISFGLSSVSLNNTFGFKVNLENLQEAKADIEYHYLTTVTLEVFIPTRDDLYPNPELDEIRCIFYAINNSIPVQSAHEGSKMLPKQACGYIIVNDYKDIIENEGKHHGIDLDVKVKVVASEIEAMQALLELCSIWDPDIFAGYEIEMSSWGYIMERAKYLNLNMSALLSRMPGQKVRDFVDEDRDQFTDLDVEMKLCGRILLDVWRLMRSEIALTSYTFENVMYHVMHRRCPWHSYRTLTNWFISPCSRWIVIEYYLERVRGTLALLDQLDLIGRTSEMAKLIGIQFYEVLSRGSQFRVESMMLRIAKPKNLVPLSPSVQQRAHMRAPEYLALIMEPASRFYADPLIVLDFQSLYPSMIIAYNYCFSTCLGRVEHLGQSTPFEFGASQLRVSPTMLRQLLQKDLVTISPCGVVFVKAEVREGILPRMLREILNTRQMVKQSMKLYKSNSALQRILHSRQLGLKLMANVTYGYTAANFSGRMPAVEVGDTVVSKGRETLERAIKMVEDNEKWNVKVVYGDTDSMFVLVPGRSREKAFEIGAEIAECVTKANPIPVKLKLEKVYQPCILQTKKRYVGYMYETPNQTTPVYEAKGIETVRRDGCPAVSKMLEKVIRILFETADVSQVKTYVCRQFTKLLSGRANLQDLIFAKEFRGLNGYKPNACVPALELTRKWMQSDPRRIPRRGERVPFIVTNGPPGVPLIRLVRSPHDILADEGLKINAIYYITKAIIPPLNRCLLLIGADVNDWFTNLPRKILTMPALSAANEVISLKNVLNSKKSTISQYFSTTNCIIDCGRQTKDGICSECVKDASKSIATVYNKIGRIERGYYLTYQICQACSGRIGDINCQSLDCPVLYILEVKRRDLGQVLHMQNLLKDMV